MRATAVPIGLLAACLTGCGAFGGSATTTHTTTRSKLAQAQATHEYPSPPPKPQTATSPAAEPVAAIRSFARRYINWRADTVTAQMSALAAQSVGQARSEMELAAAHTAGDYELRRGGVANSGTVEAIAPLTGHRREYVVVTLERTSATATTAYEGLKPAWHLALASVTQLPDGRWAVSGWQPEN
jgi:type IV pilus biogenesis protein CpaD/CtpE